MAITYVLLCQIYRGVNWFSMLLTCDVSITIGCGTENYKMVLWDGL